MQSDDAYQATLRPRPICMRKNIVLNLWFVLCTFGFNTKSEKKDSVLCFFGFGFKSEY